MSVACSAGEEREAVDPEFARQLGGDIEAARAAGATDEQVAVLMAARETGEITFDAYSETVDRALRCMREAGIDIRHDEVIEHLGLKRRSYSVPGEAEAADQQEPLPGLTVHRCVAEHSFWVEMAYQVQPTSVEAGEAHFEQYRDAIVDCLADHDIEVEPNLSQEEMSAQSTSDVEDRNIFGLCLDETGYSRS